MISTRRSCNKRCQIRSVAKEIEQEASLITQASIRRMEEMLRPLGPTIEESTRRADFYRNILTGRLETIDKSLDILKQGIGQRSRDHIVDHSVYLIYNADVANAISECFKIQLIFIASTQCQEQNWLFIPICWSTIAAKAPSLATALRIHSKYQISEILTHQNYWHTIWSSHEKVCKRSLEACRSTLHPQNKGKIAPWT